jgi:hypothetical protein
MIATVLVGPGKPKLVDIQRPTSDQARTEPTNNERPAALTPTQAAVDVSAFSPYDTPRYETPSIDSLGSVTNFAGKADPQTNLKIHPMALPERPRSSGSGCSSSGCQRHHELTDPFETPSQRTRGEKSLRAAKKRWAINGTPELDVQPFPAISPTTRTAKWLRCRKLERTLNAVTEAIDKFPASLLQLDSAVVRELRNAQVSDQTYIEILQRIFPSAPSLLVSGLTAWIIIDIYFTRMKDWSTLSVQSLAFVELSNDGLHRIPDKAREMLGIDPPSSMLIRLNEFALRKRAEAIQASIGVVEQRLVEALRGTWDEDIWRSLKVLVEVIESSRSIGYEKAGILFSC